MTVSDKDIFSNAKLWDLPSVDEQLAEQDKGTDALNRPRGKWKFEAPEEEQDITPLTAQDIEKIRQSAFQEGLKSGHEEGLKNGFEEGLKQGLEQGQEEGKKSGHEEGLKQGSEEVTQQIERLKQLVEQVHAPLLHLHSEAQKELVILAKTLAQAVIKVEIQQSNNVLLKALEDGIKALPLQENQYFMFVSNDDLPMLQSHFGEDYIQSQNWQLVASDDIAPGGLKIQTQNNAVDMSIQKRCDEVFTKLLFDQGVADDPRSQ